MDKSTYQKACERARRRGYWDWSNSDERHICFEMRYLTLKALRNGEVIDLEGIKLEMDEGDIKPGDLYVAERNTGPKLLTAKYRKYGCIFPTTLDYPFNISECVKVREVEEDDEAE